MPPKGYKTKKRRQAEEEEEAKIEEALYFLFCFYRVLSDQEKTQQLVKNINDAGKFLDTSMRILQGKDEL